jgi:hypothetical protein
MRDNVCATISYILCYLTLVLAGDILYPLATGVNHVQKNLSVSVSSDRFDCRTLEFDDCTVATTVCNSTQHQEW